MADWSGMLFPRQTDRCRCIGRDTFTAAGEPKLFACGRLHADALGTNAGKPGDICPHSVAMGADARGFAYDCEIEMRDAAFAGAHAIDCKCKKTVGRRATPLRIARREMGSDIAVGKRAENCVGKGMQGDVGIRMAGKGLRMRNADSPEHDMIARSKRVNVEAGTGSYIAEHG